MRISHTTTQLLALVMHFHGSTSCQRLGFCSHSFWQTDIIRLMTTIRNTAPPFEGVANESAKSFHRWAWIHGVVMEVSLDMFTLSRVCSTTKTSMVATYGHGVLTSLQQNNIFAHKHLSAVPHSRHCRWLPSV